MNEINQLEVCLFVKKGIEFTIWLGQEGLQNHLIGDYKLSQKDIADMHLLKIAMPTLKNVCVGRIKDKSFEEYDLSVNKIIRDMEDYAE